MTHPNNNTPHSTPEPAFFSRLALAMGSFFKILANGAYAAQVQALATGPVTVPPPAPATPPPPPTPNHDAALQLLALLQRDARLIDFTQEDLSQYSDADIGGAARVVHEGCSKVLREHFSISPLRTEAEGSRITLNAGFDARAIRLTGNVVGQPPFKGSLTHGGWRATEVRLPQLAAGHDTSVLAQAEVEL